MCACVLREGRGARETGWAWDRRSTRRASGAAAWRARKSSDSQKAQQRTLAKRNSLRHDAESKGRRGGRIGAEIKGVRPNAVRHKICAARIQREWHAICAFGCQLCTDCQIDTPVFSLWPRSPQNLRNVAADQWHLARVRRLHTQLPQIAPRNQKSRPRI
jgi:hypothetical protein